MRRDRDSSAADVIAKASAFASDQGVDLDAEWDGVRIMFMIHRRSASPGSGATVLANLLALADDSRLPVMLDVLESEPALVRYYWRFGFRILDGTAKGERDDLLKLEAERRAFLARPENEGHAFGVTTMWRDRHAGALPDIDTQTGEDAAC